MKKALVLYYTCSKNTQKIAENTEEILMDMDWEVRVSDLRSYDQNKDPFEADLVILGVPVHYWEIPDAALRMIRELPQFKNTAGFVFTTFGKCVCNSVPYSLAKELQAKGVLILGGGQIAMPHSALIDGITRIGDVETSFGKGEPTSENQEKFKAVIRDIAKKVESGNVEEIDVKKLKKLRTGNAMVGVMNIFTTVDRRRNVLPDVQHDNEKCIQCYVCLDSCDNQAIKISDENEITIDKTLCKKCYKCTEVCVDKAMYTDWDKMIYWVRFVHRLAKNTNTVLVA